MSLYIDNCSIIDTDYVSCVHMVEGAAEHDRRYGLAYLLVSGDRLKRLFVDYQDKYARDAAFKTLAALMGREREDEEGVEL